jgi:hypothetical protein
MAFYQAWTERLQAARIGLQENTIINDPMNYSKLTGFLDFLLNPSLNPRTIDVIQQQNSQAGTYRSVEIRSQAHWGTEDTVTTDASASCTSNDQRRDDINTYNVDLFVHTKFTIDEDYIRENTEVGDSQQGRLERGFRSAMRLNRESVDSQLLAKAAANMGSNPAQGADAGDYTTVQVLDSNDGVDVGTFDTFKNDQEDNFMGGPVAIVGLGNARKYFNRMAVGNVNTNAGVDIVEIANQFGGLLFKDQSTTTNLGGANRVLAIYPGLTQFYGYNLYNGVFAKETPDSLIKGTMPDPIYNFDWDYKIKYDDQCDTGNGLQGAWVVEVFKYFDLYTTPAAAFGGSYSDLGDFNGIVGYNLTSVN